jgi:tripartite-type tricarboxylate transporter receptor subunit TctC
MFSIRHMAIAGSAFLILFGIQSHPLRAADDAAPQIRSFSVLVATSAGGGYDLYARVLARHISKHILGSPPVIVKNMPGGGGLVAANYLYNLSPKDGSEIAALEHGTAFAPVLNGVAVKFDPLQFGWLGSLESFVPIVLAWHTSDVKSIEDLKTKTLRVGASGVGSNTSGYPYSLAALLGLKLEVVNGYPGSREIMFAIEKGEVDGVASWCWDCLKSAKPDWVANKKANVLLQISINGDPELNALGIPTAMGLAQTDTQKDYLRVILASAEFGRPFAAPPSLAPGRLKDLREAFARTAQDPEMIQEMEKRNSIIRFSAPEELEMLLRSASKLDAKTVSTLQAIYSGRAPKPD